MEYVDRRLHDKRLGLGLVVASALTWAAGCGAPDPGPPPAPDAALKQALSEGKEHMMAERKDEAIAAYTRAIALDPQCKEAYVWRGVAYNETGRHQQALADFTKAIELDPRDSYPYEQRAAIYRRVLKDEAKARADTAAAQAIRQKRWQDLQNLRKGG